MVIFLERLRVALTIIRLMFVLTSVLSWVKFLLFMAEVVVICRWFTLLPYVSGPRIDALALPSARRLASPLLLLATSSPLTCCVPTRSTVLLWLVGLCRTVRPLDATTVCIGAWLLSVKCTLWPAMTLIIWLWLLIIGKFEMRQCLRNVPVLVSARLGARATGLQMTLSLNCPMWCILLVRRVVARPWRTIFRFLVRVTVTVTWSLAMALTVDETSGTPNRTDWARKAAMLVADGSMSDVVGIRRMLLKASVLWTRTGLLRYGCAVALFPMWTWKSLVYVTR